MALPSQTSRIASGRTPMFRRKRTPVRPVLIAGGAVIAVIVIGSIWSLSGARPSETSPPLISTERVADAGGGAPKAATPTVPGKTEASKPIATLPPAVEHPRSEAGSIVGGYVYRGAKIPCLRGRYVYADYATGRFFSFVWDGKAATDRVELTSALNPNGLPSSFGEDAAGEVYVVMFNTGRIYRIDPG